MKRIPIKSESVLNTDSFDRRRYHEIKGMSGRLQQLEDNGKEVFPTFPSLMGDIWAALYKMKPVIKEDVSDGMMTNKTIMEQIMQDESFLKFRDTTRLDDLSSAIGSVRFSEETFDWLKEQEACNKQFSDALQQIQQQQAAFNQAHQELQRDGASQKAQNQFAKAEQALQQALDNLAQQFPFDSGFSQAMAQAVQSTKEIKEGLKGLVGGIKAGSSEAELKKVPLREKLKLADIISSNAKVKEIARWAGRFKAIAQKKQKSKHNKAIDRSGVTMGSEVEKLLPMELGVLSHPVTKNDFLRRFAEGQTMVYDTKGKVELGKGPIVLCLDQSGSMHSLDTQSKGFALALMSIARKQKRDFALIPFSKRVRKYVYKKGKISLEEMISMATSFLDGGTNFVSPLRCALEVIENSRFNKADLIFVTDGEASLHHEFVQQFNLLKKEKGFHVLGVVLGHERAETVERFSDKVVRVSSFLDESALEAFEI